MNGYNQNRNPYGGYQNYGPVAGNAPAEPYQTGPYGAEYGDHVLMDEGYFEGDISNPAVMAFTKKVYAYFGAALATATAAAFGGTMAVDHYISVGNGGAVTGIWVGSLIAFFASYLIVVFSRKSHSKLKTALLFVFATACGGMLSPILMANVAAGMGMAIVTSFGIASVLFFGLSVYVLTTGKDFRSLGGMLLVGILVFVGLALMSWFIDFPSILSHALMAGGFLLFVGFVLYDVSRVVRDNFYANDAVSAAIQLLFDFVMLFRFALYFLGIGGRD